MDGVYSRPISRAIRTLNPQPLLDRELLRNDALTFKACTTLAS